MNKDIIYQGHSEVQKYHYRALSDPMYRMEMMMSVLREDLMMNMPVPFFQEPVTTPEAIVKTVSYKEMQQLRGQLQYLQRKIQERTTKRDTNDYY